MTINNSKLSKTNRYGACDLLRFIFSLLIMAHHIYQIGFENAPFHAALIYVEFFFLVSGFFMIHHFEKGLHSITAEQSAKEALKYSFRKLKSLMYYILPCILLEYMLRVVACLVSTGDLAQVGKILLNLPLEIFMISPLTDTRYLPPIWYVSAMMIVMPLLCFLYLRFRSAFVYVISWSIPVIIFIARGGVWPSADGLDALMRAYCYLSVGCFLYYASMYMKQKLATMATKGLRILLTIIEVMCFASTIIFTANNWEQLYDLIVLLFAIGITIMMSGCSYTIYIQGKFFSYLGKLSLPIYTIHWSVGTFIGLVYSLFKKMSFPFPLSVRIVLYYALTIVASVIFCFIVDRIKYRRCSLKGRSDSHPLMIK
ncbi:MAG: acyltransferase [Clostridia bacterium]|nr:acyltransferase [Clostridia bacterium]